MRQSPASSPARRSKLPAEGPRVRRADGADRARPRRRGSDRVRDAAQPQPIGEALLAAGLIDRATLSWALARQRRPASASGRSCWPPAACTGSSCSACSASSGSLPFVDLLNTRDRRGARARLRPARRCSPRAGSRSRSKAIARSSRPANRPRAEQRERDPRHFVAGREDQSAARRRRSTSSAPFCSASASISSAARPASCSRAGPTSRPPPGGRPARSASSPPRAS